MTATPGAPKPPEPFLHCAYEDLSQHPHVWAYCVGYENGVWRQDAFVEHILEWLPEFCLNYSEAIALGAGNALPRLRKAAGILYQSANYQRRGEFGEVFLHMIVRHQFQTLPAISKIHFKDGPNETVKGFDLVHVVVATDGLELWLGEAKFYDDPVKAAKAAAKSLKVHENREYLRNEFVSITNKIDASWPHAADLAKLLHKNTSLDDVFKRLVVPVLLAFPEESVAAATECTKTFHEELKLQLAKHGSTFSDECPLAHHKVKLFMLPVPDKAKLAKALDIELKALQHV